MGEILKKMYQNTNTTYFDKVFNKFWQKYLVTNSITLYEKVYKYKIHIQQAYLIVFKYFYKCISFPLSDIFNLHLNLDKKNK